MIVIKTRQPDPELEQKIRMLLEREHIEAEQISIDSWEKLVLPGLTLDGMTHEVSCKGRKVSLTRLEFDLLLMLASHEGQIFSKEELFRAGYVPPAPVSYTHLDVYKRQDPVLGGCLRPLRFTGTDSPCSLGAAGPAVLLQHRRQVWCAGAGSAEKGLRAGDPNDLPIAWLHAHRRLGGVSAAL